MLDAIHFLSTNSLYGLIYIQNQAEIKRMEVLK